MIETKKLIKTYVDGDKITPVLKEVDFKAESGEFIAIMGRSGAGKSTFLYQLSLLDEPTGGEVIIDGIDTHNMTADEKTSFRLTELGYVFQDYALLPDLTAKENVALPLLMQGKSKEDAYAQATSALEKAGLGHRIDFLPSQMSGGEQQRVSISRAVAHKPKILFADEPTANLDNYSSGLVMDMFKELHKEGQTIIMVTHEPEYGRIAERLIRFDDGKIVGEERMDHGYHSSK